MRWAYIGNFAPAHSTENEYRRALEASGHVVTALQENTPEAWEARYLLDLFDAVMWTRTGWDWPHTACGWSHEEACGVQRAFLAAARNVGVPTVAVHLDRWWGLAREGQVHDEPFFRCDLVCTADGGHDDEWKAAGVNHRWLPPAVSEFECVGGTYNPRYAADVAFVGSWRPGYHPEHKHRPELVRFLQRRYRGRVAFWPKPGKPAVRGPALRDLYASTKVNVGDSCLSGGATRYFSDRIPETLGRGGFLIHPHVEGVTDGPLYTDGEHLATWYMGDWDGLANLIDGYLDDPVTRSLVASTGREHVLEHHTYTVRVRQIEAMLREEGLL